MSVLSDKDFADWYEFENDGPGTDEEVLEFAEEKYRELENECVRISDRVKELVEFILQKQDKVATLKEPCEYCQGQKESKTILAIDAVLDNEVEHDVYVAANSPRLVAMRGDFLESFSQKINYCPMCGRKLEEV